VELDRATGLTLSHAGIEIEDAVRGTVQREPAFSGVTPRTIAQQQESKTEQN
jgi:hypothetical protein